MINFFSTWAEQLVLAIVISSIIEMVLPESKNKKYIKMMLGIYVLFTILSPVVNKKISSVDSLNLESYAILDNNTKTTSDEKVNQQSMDERLQELYIQELEKNIKNKVEQEGYDVISCQVDAVLYGDKENQEIKKIKIVVYKKTDDKLTNNKNEETNLQDQSDNINSNTKSDIQNIDKVEINVGLNKILGESNGDETTEETKVTNNDAKKLKEILSSYYEIDSKKINISVK